MSTLTARIPAEATIPSSLSRLLRAAWQALTLTAPAADAAGSQRLDDLATVYRLAREAESVHPSLAAELRAIAARA